MTASIPWGEMPVQGLVRVSAMPIIEEYDAIAKRLHELRAASPNGAAEITNLERWRDLARQTVQEYIEDRRRRVGKPTQPILPRRF